MSSSSRSNSSIDISTIRERRKRKIETAACLIIGDEVLGGKTVDTNSAFFAKWCFRLGINLRVVKIIPDDEGDIVEAARGMSLSYDLVVTSGGIGPTHDDITYASLSKAFSPPFAPAHPLTQHAATLSKMRVLARPHPSQPAFDYDTPSPALDAKLRMVTLPLVSGIPHDEQVIFPREDLWEPIAVCAGNVHVLPGVPRLFEQMLAGLEQRYVDEGKIPSAQDAHAGMTRILIETKLAESQVATYLGQLAERVEARGVKVGSYPRWGKSRNTVSLVGRDHVFMESLVAEVEREVEGRRVATEGENDSGGE